MTDKERRAQMPKACRATYDRAMGGKSRKAAMAAFCAECMGYEVIEIFLCTDDGCPLFPYRPSSRASQDMPESNGDGPEAPNGREGG